MDGSAEMRGEIPGGPPMTLRVSDRIRDNDPRMESRVLEVVGFDVRVERRPVQGSTLHGQYGVARCQDGNRIRDIRLDRIHLDDKARKSGWSIVR